MTASSRRSATLQIALLAGCMILAGCEDPTPQATIRERGVPPPELPVCAGESPTLEVEEIARGLEVPWGMAPTPDDRVFVTERPGRIRVIEDGTLREDPWFEFDVEHGHEIGLMGIALAPDFGETGHLFVVTSHVRPEPLGGVPLLGWALRRIRNRLPGDGGSSLITRVQRVTDLDGSGTDPVVWVDALPAAILHAGGALLPLPEGGLLVSLGDGMEPWSAQDSRSLKGSILHIPSTETPPPGRRLEPREHRIAKGVRNVQGMGFLGPDSSVIAFIDHGPSGLGTEGGRQGKDELNVLDLHRETAPGSDGSRGRDPANFGWPIEAGLPDQSEFVPPIVEWTPALAPGGMVTLPGDGRAEDSGTSARVVVAGLRGQSLVQVIVRREADEPAVVDPVAQRRAVAGWRAECELELLGEEWGRLRAVVAISDRELLVSTSNRDGRGRVREGDDRILQLRWVPPVPGSGTNLDISSEHVPVPR